MNGTKFFQAFPKKIQAFPRKFQTFPSFFQGIPNIFLGRFQRNQGLVAAPSDFLFFHARVWEFPSPRRRARRTPSDRPPRRRKHRRRFPFTTISVFPEEKCRGRPGERAAARPAGARAIGAKAAGSPNWRRTGPSGFEGSPPTSAIGREVETRRTAASRPPSMGETRLARRAGSPSLQRATRHSDARPPFEVPRRRIAACGEFQPKRA